VSKFEYICVSITILSIPLHSPFSVFSILGESFYFNRMKVVLSAICLSFILTISMTFLNFRRLALWHGNLCWPYMKQAGIISLLVLTVILLGQKLSNTLRN